MPCSFRGDCASCPCGLCKAACFYISIAPRRCGAILPTARRRISCANAATANAAWKTTSSGTIYTQTAKPGYLTGFQKIDKKVYYFNGQGILQKGWITVDKKRYYADAKTGEIAISKWVNQYYFREDGSLAVNTWIDGKWVGADGRYTGVKNNVGFVTDNGKTYYYDAMTHQTAKGWLNVGGKTYYMDPVTGAMKKGWIKVGDLKLD